MRLSVVFPQFDAWAERHDRKLDAILDLLKTDPQAVSKIRAATAQLKTDTDKLEGEVQKHGPEGQE